MSDSQLARGTGRAAGVNLTATEFTRRLGRLRDDVETSLLCTLLALLEKRGRRETFSVLKEGTKTFAESLISYVASDMSEAAVAIFRPIERSLPPKLNALISFEDDPGALVTAEAMRSIREDIQRTFHSVDLELAQARIAELAETSGTTLRAYAGAGTVYGSIVGGVDQAERELMPRVPLFTLEIGRRVEQAREEFLMWFRLVRMCLATSVLAGIPYETLWGQSFARRCGSSPEGIYGTAGYWLAQEVAEVAKRIAQFSAFQQFATAAEGHPWLTTYASLSRALAEPSQFPLARKLDELGAEPGAWQRRCAPGSGKYDVAEQGTIYPFEFPPITADVHNNPDLLATGDQDEQSPLFARDHMYAREGAQILIRYARTHWDNYRLVLKAGLAVNPATEADPQRRELDFRITAGSLRYGGAHPPHRAHRNGAMFDVVVRGVLPLHCEGQPQISEAESVQQARNLSSRGGTEPTIPVVEGHLDVQPPRPKRSVASPIFFEGPMEDLAEALELVRGNCQRWDYPPRELTWNDGQRARPIRIEEVGQCITQCILLTFPSQVIFADWRTLRDANNKLIVRIGSLATNQTSDESKEAIVHLLNWLGKPVGVLPPTPLGSGRFSLLPGHHHHWHVSYSPAEVEQPPKGRTAALRWIDEHIATLLSD